MIICLIHKTLVSLVYMLFTYYKLTSTMVGNRLYFVEWTRSVDEPKPSIDNSIHRTLTFILQRTKEEKTANSKSEPTVEKMMCLCRSR